MPRQNRRAGCPGRWRLVHSSKFANPHRPPVCPCLWSDNLIEDHFKKSIQEDMALAVTLSHLMTLWP